MISIRGAADSNWPVSLPTSSAGRNSSPFFSKNSPEPSGCTDSKFLVSPVSFSASASAGGAGQFRRRRLDHGQDRSLAVERLLELVVALAPVQIGRNQRVDVGVDREIAGRVEARRDRQDERDQDR